MADLGLPDLIIVGGGGVGMASALAAAERGLTVTLVAGRKAGEAFPAGAGILGPSVEFAEHDGGGPEHAFALASRDYYPAYLAKLSAQSGISVSLNRLGILAVAMTAVEAELAKAGEWLDRAALARLEPALAPVHGAWYHPDDGAVDNNALFEALEVAVEREGRIRLVDGPVVSLAVAEAHVGCQTVTGARLTAPQLILAAGAWSPLIAGLPRPLPVEPVRGQMLSYALGPLRHVVFGAGGYLVPRGDRTLAGATMERAAFDASTTRDGLAEVTATAMKLCPALARASIDKSWAGLRPVSPDFLPILGRDPDYPSLIYACGHSRNGILMAPLTADCLAALAVGDQPVADLSPFSIDRFELTNQVI